MKQMIKQKNRAKNMSMDERWRGYEQDKRELYTRLGNMTVEQIAAAHAELRDKWRV